MEVKPVIYRTLLPLFITFACSVVLISEFFVDITAITMISVALKTSTSIIFAFSIVLGTVSLLLWVRKKMITEKNWSNRGFSILLLLTLLLFLVIGSIFGIDSNLYSLLFTSINFPIMNAFEGMVCFWMVKMAYSSWRLRNIESGALLGIAFITLVSLSPWAQMLWPGFAPVYEWIMNYINKPGMRGIIMAGALGLFIVSLRTIFGKERGYLGG